MNGLVALAWDSHVHPVPGAGAADSSSPGDDVVLGRTDPSRSTWEVAG